MRGSPPRDQLPVTIRRPDKRPAKPTLASLEAEAAAFPEAARAIATEGVRRLVAYQGPGYARLYLDRLKPLPDHGKLLAETARHLAVRMSFEDVIRVAEAKIAPERFRRIEGEINAKDQPYVITEFLKPGIEELCQVLPPRLARAMVDYAEARLARHRLFRHGAEDHDGVGLSALLGAREAEALPPEELALRRRADRDRSLARARRGGREALARARARNRRARA